MHLIGTNITRRASIRYFELCLSKVAVFFDPDMLVVSFLSAHHPVYLHLYSVLHCAVCLLLRQCIHASSIGANSLTGLRYSASLPVDK